MKQSVQTLCVLLLMLCAAGCGSDSSPAITVSCSTHRLASGRIRARVTVTNTTNGVSRAILYGPALANLTYIHPVLALTQVVVRVGSDRRAYFGYVIPSLAAGKNFHVLLRFAASAHAKSLVATPSRAVSASGWDVLDNASCRL